MTRFATVFAVVLAGAAGEARAFCQPGDVASCFANGQQGTMVCGDDARFGPCSTAFQPQSGTCQPKYKILTVLYAPPGKTGGGSNSHVNYGTSSTFGTTTSSSNGIQTTYSIAASALPLFDNGSYTVSNNSVESSSIDIHKDNANSIASPGPTADGIDHDQDQVWLILGPTVDVTFTSPTAMQWSLDTAVQMNVQFVYVGWLKNPALIPAGLQAQFNSVGITAADYPDMLAADPFADGDVPVDTSRYAAINMTFPYEPPFTPDGTGPTVTYTLTHSVGTTDSVSVTHQSSVSLTSGFGALLASLKKTNTWTWTDTNTHAESTGTSDSASVTVGSPSFGYAGPTSIAVYYDRIYRTFLFKPFFSGQAALSGSVAGAGAGVQVDVVSNGVTYTGFTNSQGVFRVFGVPPGAPLQVRAGSRQVTLAPADVIFPNRIDSSTLPPPPAKGDRQ